MNAPWPHLHFEEYKETSELVHLWTQIVGKIRLKKTPWLNHSWHVSLYVTPRGLSTRSMPYDHGIFEIEFDFHDHILRISTSEGKTGEVKLRSMSVSTFYHEVFHQLIQLGIKLKIHAAPNELDPAIPFADDTENRKYDPEAMHKLWQVMVAVDNVFTRFRANFIGKCSPIHLFWGAFDLAVTRFSGDLAPEHPGGGMPNMPLEVMKEAYSHEVSSCGFWPGSRQSPQPIFYSYCYPTPPDFQNGPVEPKEAFYSTEMGEFILPYEAVATSEHPETTLMLFLQSTYEAAAKSMNWDRKLLEADYSAFN